MKNQIEKIRRLTVVIRRTARILSIASIGTILLFIVGEGFHPMHIKLKEWIGLLFFPFGISVGMILAWWKENLGGSITVGSLLMFYVVHFAISGRSPNGWAWVVFSAPGFLFLLSWFLMRRVRKSAC